MCVDEERMLILEEAKKRIEAITWPRGLSIASDGEDIWLQHVISHVSGDLSVRAVKLDNPPF